MAKSKSPLFGLEASGTVGDSVVFAKWRGVQYARRHVIPANPRTTEQLKTRSVFSFLNQLWARAPALLHEPWAAYASGRPLTDRNAFMKFNIPLLRESSDLGQLMGSPGVSGGFALASLSASGGIGYITAEATPYQVPSGWSIDYVVFVVVADQDPHDPFGGVIMAQSDTTVPYSAMFSSLSSGTYRVLAWARYTKPDGSKAFSPSLITSAEVL